MDRKVSSSEEAQATYSASLERIETTDNCYHYPSWQKWTVVAITSWTTLAATFSSTSLFSAANEIAAEFSSDVVAINISSAGVILAMGFSSFIWGPISEIAGNRFAYNACAGVLLLFTIGTALAPNLQAFVALRVLSGFQGTYFHVAGQIILARYFPPIQRGTATGFFLAGSVLGPPLGPCIAGIIVTYQNWRVILWLQAGMIGLGLLMSLLFVRVPATMKEKAKTSSDISSTLAHFNPLHVFRLMSNPSILFTDLTCGLLSWTQYSLLSGPRHIINHRFQLESPLYAGLFYIAPATGFLVGTLVGGIYSDKTVKRWIEKRDGLRLPRDRLNSGMFSFFLIIPAASLVYGWGLTGKDTDIALLAIPAISAFFMAAGLLAAFASLNTFCAEVLPEKRSQVITGKYCVQYTLSAIGSATAVPLIDAAGVGPSSTLSAILVLIAGGLTLFTAKRGEVLQPWITNAKHLYHNKWHASGSSIQV